MKSAWRWIGRVGLLVLVFVLAYQLWLFAHVCWWVFYNPSTSAFMEDRRETLQERKPSATLRH